MASWHVVECGGCESADRRTDGHERSTAPAHGPRALRGGAWCHRQYLTCHATHITMRCLHAITNALEGFIGRSLAWMGKHCAGRPKTVILASVVSCLVLMAGFAVNFEWESDGAKLWCVNGVGDLPSLS